MVALPQFGLLAQVSSLRLPSGHSGQVLTLSNAARASLFSPCLLVAAARALGVALRQVICAFYLFMENSRQKEQGERHENEENWGEVNSI